jgi:phosphate-selective porin
MMNKLMIMSLFAAAFGAANAQEGDSTKTQSAPGMNLEEAVTNVKGQVDGLNESYLETKATVDKLAKIKVGGYIQAQWQLADSVNQASVNGGSFLPTSDERLMLRRARLKTTYQGATSRYVMEIDALPTGIVIKDINAQISEPWLKAFSLTAGVMDRPFGFEVGYSSSMIELPERTRGSQILMPGEKDLGVEVEFAGTEQMGLLEHINFKAGAFTGLGSGLAENDREKDYIGRLGFTLPFYDINLAVDGGFSAYMGKVTNSTGKVAKVGKVADSLSWVNVTGKKALELYDRNLMGVDAQVYYDIPVIGGISLRGEYWWGDWVSVNGNTALYTLGDTNGVYLRKVSSWYMMAVQNIGNKNQLAVRYDMFDPNTDVEGGDIGRAKSSKLNVNDAAQSTLGLGWNYFWDDAVRFTLNYDINMNEKTSKAAGGAAFTKWSDDFENNQWTVRMQVKF